MEENIRAHISEVAVFSDALYIILEYLRVESIADNLFIVSFKTQLFLKLLSDGIKIFRLKKLSRSAGNRLSAFQHNLLDVLREAAFRLTHHSFKI